MEGDVSPASRFFAMATANALGGRGAFAKDSFNLQDDGSGSNDEVSDECDDVHPSVRHSKRQRTAKCSDAAS